MLATQSVQDLASTDLLRTVVESCPTKLLLANPGMDRDAVAGILHLNQTETELLVNLRPRRQLLLKRPDYSKVLNLEVDPQSYGLYTNTPPDNTRMRDAALQQVPHMLWSH